MLMTWVPDALRAAGLTVQTYPGWETRGHGDYDEPLSVVWHHDASPAGDSPGVPESMIRRWDIAAAPAWVDRDGVWHIIASGVAWHAGRVLPGKCGNHDSYGIETDHTVGEDWPPALLDSLRRGTAAIFTRLGRSPDPGLEFHQTICRPVGRKIDPDGLDLATERAAVAALMAGQAPPPPVAPASHASSNLTGTNTRRPNVDLIDLRDVTPLVRHPGMKALQRLLDVADDGLGGPNTRAALGRAQSRAGIARDYIFGPESAEAFLAGKAG